MSARHSTGVPQAGDPEVRHQRVFLHTQFGFLPSRTTTRLQPQRVADSYTASDGVVHFRAVLEGTVPSGSGKPDRAPATH